MLSRGLRNRQRVCVCVCVEDGHPFALYHKANSLSLFPMHREDGANTLLDESGHKVDVNQVSCRGSALLEAIRLNAPILIEKLIATPGIDVNLADSGGTTPLMAAVEMDSPLLIYKLVSGRPNRALRGLLTICIYIYRCVDE